MKIEPYCLPPGDEHPVQKKHMWEGEDPAGDLAEVLVGLDDQETRQSALRCLSTLECTYCDVCQWVCPDMCITRDSETGHINIDLDYCKGCGLCAHFCPKGAINMVVEPNE